MTAPASEDGEPRRATIETRTADPATARLVVAALRPDNTDAMEMTADGAVVRTAIERETTGGLQATVDDYLVNASVAETVIRTATRPTDREPTQTTHRQTPNTTDSDT